PGLLSGLSGTLGDIVYYNRNGKQCARRKPAKSDKPPTVAQEAHRAKFALVNDCLKPAKAFIAIGFASFAKEMTAFNKATSLAMAEAVIGEYPDYTIDYSQLKLSKGTLPDVYEVFSETIDGENIRFAWKNLASDDVSGKHKAIFIALCPELALCVHSIGDAMRSAATEVLRTDGLTGKQVHTYLAFIDGHKVSDSMYAGTLLMDG
ncbi:MAG: hypothetical protein JST39_19085, partial [Bacteroidetes bacterium]|nr:hypothetical protein [Bacteroidota bacterium]